MKKYSLYYFVLITSLYVTLLLLFADVVDPRYELLYFLPLSSLLATIINYKALRYCTDNLVVLTLFVSYFIRNVVAIYFFNESSYVSIMNDFTKSDVNISVFIMSIDVILVYHYLAKNVLKKESKYLRDKSIAYSPVLNNSLLFNATLLVSIIFVAISWSIVPAIGDNYSTIMDVEFAVLNTIDINAEVKHGGIDRILLTISLILVKILRIVLPIYVYYWSVRTINYAAIRYIVFYLTVYLQLFFISSETMDVILVTGVLFIINHKFERSNRSFFFSGAIGTALIVSFIVLQKLAVLNDVDGAASIFLQGYFPGIYNMATAVSMESSIYKMNSLFSDIYTMIPFRQTIFNIDAGPNTNDIFNAKNQIQGQIVPFIGEAFYYIGYVAFIVPILVVKVSFHYYFKSLTSDNMFSHAVYTYISIYFALAPVLYHSTILGSFYLSTCIPMLALLKFRKMYLGGNKNQVQ